MNDPIVGINYPNEVIEKISRKMREKLDQTVSNEEIINMLRSIQLIGDLKRNPLDQLLRKAVIEADRFGTWKNSGEPLNNIRFFHKINDKYVPVVQQYQMSFFYVLKNVVRIRMIGDSQFEVWECDENDDRLFPLYRLPASEIYEGRGLFVGEKLRDNCALRIKASKSGDIAAFTFSISDISGWFLWYGKIQSFLDGVAERWSKGPQLLRPQMILPMVLILSISGFLTFSKVQNQAGSTASPPITNPAGDTKTQAKADEIPLDHPVKRASKKPDIGETPKKSAPNSPEQQGEEAKLLDLKLPPVVQTPTTLLGSAEILKEDPPPGERKFTIWRFLYLDSTLPEELREDWKNQGNIFSFHNLKSTEAPSDTQKTPEKKPEPPERSKPGKAQGSMS